MEEGGEQRAGETERLPGFHAVVRNCYESLHEHTRATCSHMNSAEQKRKVQKDSYNTNMSF